MEKSYQGSAHEELVQGLGRERGPLSFQKEKSLADEVSPLVSGYWNPWQSVMLDRSRIPEE